MPGLGDLLRDPTNARRVIMQTLASTGMPGITGSGIPYSQGEVATRPENFSQLQGLMDEVAGGDPQKFIQASDFLRGAAEGPVDPRMAEALTTPEQQALADRYGWGADIADQGYGPLPLIPPMIYEGVKAVAPGALGAIGSVLPQGEAMEVREGVTSPASMQNIAALIAGYRSR